MRTLPPVLTMMTNHIQLVLNNRRIICPGEELSDLEAGIRARYKALENLSPAYLKKWMMFLLKRSEG